MHKLYPAKMLLLCVVLASSAVGCSDAYGTSAKLAQDVAVSVNQANTTVDQLRIAGTITAAEERSVLGYMNSLNTLDGQYIACVQVAHGSTVAGGFTKCVQTLLAGITDPNTLIALHVSNPASQQKVTAISQGIQAIVNATVAALGGR